MAPRTQPWPHKEPSSNVNNNNNSSLALVLEDYEVFEAETAELSIEDVDDFSSLLLDVENPATNGDAYYGQETCELITLVTRNFHPVHSAHSLATTSIVAPAQHAHTAEYKLLASTSCSHANSRLSELSDGSYGTEQRETSFLPVHMLAAVFQCGQPRPPACWPDQLLAYTDAPAFVNAVHADLTSICSRFDTPGPVHIVPCDQAPEWTTCQLTCCQAGVEWLASRLPGRMRYPSAGIQASPSTSVHTVGRKRSHPDIESIPIQVRSHTLELPQALSTGLYAFSGLHPETLRISPTFTAIYLLLVCDENNALSSPHQEAPSWSGSGSQTAVFAPSRSTVRRAESPSVWAMLVSLAPWSESPNIIPDVNNSRRIPPGCENGVLRTRWLVEQHVVALLALIDVVMDTDENGCPVFRAVIHQRLHHLPELNVRLEET